MEDRLELTSTAQVLGDIECGVLVVEAGALIRGKLSMKGMGAIEDPKQDKKPSLMRKMGKEETLKVRSRTGW